jgi:hypothetical protein
VLVPVRATMLAAAGTVLAAALVMPGPASAATVRHHYRVAATLQPNTVMVGRRITVTGWVRPRASGDNVKLQLSTGSAWHTVSVGALGERSRYAVTYMPPGAGTYLLRVRKPADGGHRRGTSRTLTLTVTPSLPPM